MTENPNVTANDKAAKPKLRPAPVWHASREFEFLDGRLITIVRHAVRFFTPLRSDPENATLVGLKDADAPVPLKIAYADFRAWFAGV